MGTIEETLIILFFLWLFGEGEEAVLTRNTGTGYRCQSGYYNNNDLIKPYIQNFNSNALMNKSNIQTNELIRGRFCIT